MKEIHKPRMTANMAMVTDANGFPSASTTITKTELGMLNNIRTNIQTQIDAKPDKTNVPGYPDLTAEVKITAYPFTMPADGWLIVSYYQIDVGDTSDYYLNGTAIAHSQFSPNFAGVCFIQIPVKQGDIFTRSEQKHLPLRGGFYPYKAQ